MALSRRQLIVIIILVIIAAGIIGGYYYFTRERILLNINDSFETSLEPWETGYDLPQDPNNPGHFVAWSITRSENQSASGDYSLRLYVDGRQDDGTIWIQRNIDGIRRGRNITLEFRLFSSSQSFNTLAVVVGFIGSVPPANEEDFTVLGSANEVEGWKPYKMSLEIDDETDVLWIAVGISVRWEAQLVYYIDDVAITVV
jgi:hypothetical protein